MKRCTKCGEVKPISEFYSLPNGNGHRPHCKKCHLNMCEISRRSKGISPRRPAAVTERTNGGIIERKCSRCGTFKPISEFRDRIWGHGVFKDKVCRDCRTLQSNTHEKRMKRCAKIFCKSVRNERLTEIICPVCGIKFGVLNYEYRSKDAIGRPRKFCSKECYWESMKKSWSEKSPYAQNIKRIRKEQRL